MLFKWFSRLYHTIVFIIFFGIFIHIFCPVLVEASPMTNAFINEIHYDNNGADENEYVEIAGDATIDLSGWSLRLYNGNNGEEGKSFSLNRWSYIDTSINFGLLTVETKGIQNGSPDGIVLFDGTSVIQFLSYEGAFKATSGVAFGLTSVDINVLEPSTTPVGFSLQLTGQGKQYSDFTWVEAQQNTFGSVNIDQQFIDANLKVIQVNEPSSLLLFSVLLIFIIRRPFDPSFDCSFLALRTNGKSALRPFLRLLVPRAQDER